MKIVKCILSILLVVIFAQCGKDDEKVDDLIKVSVFQTMWEGTLKDRQGKEYAVRLLFDYESFGTFLYKTNNDDSFDDEQGFKYNQEGRIIKIFPIYPIDIIVGEWWITKYDGKHMTLTRDPETTFSSTITLTQIIK